MSVRYWKHALILLVLNTFLWFSFLPAYQTTVLKLNESLGEDLTGKPKEVFDNIINQGLADIQILIIVADVVVILWAIMASQRKERLTGVYG